MLDNYDLCPKCGKKVLIGATRCLACSAVLKTEEEQKAMIKQFTERKQGINKAAVFKFISYLIVLGIIYYFFSEEIMSLKDYLTGK